MVGYHKHDSLTSKQKLIAGCLSGVATRFITQPLDVIKLRTQVQKVHATKKTSMLKTFRRILFEEGLSAFWHGHMLGQMHSVLSVSSQFYVYELATQYCADNIIENVHSSYVRLFCGTFAGCISATLVLPLEVIRVRQMLVKEQYSSFLKGAYAVYRYGGILAFYEGLSASILQMGPQVGVSFVVFSYFQPMILHFLQSPNDVEECDKDYCVKPANRYNAQNLLIASSVAGSMAGLISKTVTYPLDLAKRRLQIGSHRFSSKYNVPSTAQNLIKCNNLVDCISKTIRKEGFRGLYRGWTVTVSKAQVTSVVAFTTYELLCFAIREYNGAITPS